METITTAYEALGAYGAIIMLILFVIVVALGVGVYKLHTERDRLLEQLNSANIENAELKKQVSQQALIIGQQKAQITGLNQVVSEQSGKLKQHENFIEALKKAQEKVRNERSGKPTDEVYVGTGSGIGNVNATSSKKDGSNRFLITGGLMLARMVLMTVGVPPIF